MNGDLQALREALAATVSGDDPRAEAALDRFAEGLARRVADRVSPVRRDGWLTTRAAATYLGMTPAALHKLTGARAVPFEQEGPGCRCHFDRAALDEWQRAGRPRTIRLEAA